MGNMFLRKYKYFLFLVFSISCFAQPGKDGALTISTSKTVLNRYSRVTTDILAGSNTVTVVDINDLNRDAIPYLPAGYVLNSSSFNSNALSTGDLIMLYQAQGALINTTNSINYGSVTNVNGAGTYELAYVESVSGNKITLSCTSKLSYFAARYVQVIRIPQYTTLTIDSGASVVAIPWGDPTFGGADPSANERRRGGFNAVIANNIINNGSVNANQAGFRGGTRENSSGAAGAAFNLDFYTTDARLSAEKGESIVGYRPDYDAIGGRYGRGAAANGGGGGNSHNAGGGGGANGGDVTNWFRGAGVMNDFGTCGIPGAWALDPNYIANGSALTNSAGGGHGGYSYGTNLVDACAVGPSYPANFIAPGVPAATVLGSDWTGDFRDAVGGLGGRPVTSPNYQNQIFFGGGGGAGDGNNTANSDGGDGGGIVFIVVTNSISGSGVIQANGENGFDTNFPHTDAPGGGGGGGTVLIQSNTIANTQAINANGGSGGNQLIKSTENEGPGGGGGGGVLSINATSDSSIKTVTGGSNGTTTASSLTEFKADGATSGNSGSILSIAVNLNYSECQVDLQTTKTVNNTTPQVDDSVVFTITVINNGPLVATGVFATDAVPSGYTVTAVSTSAGTWLAPNWTIGNLTNGQSATLNITAKVNATGNYTNTSTVTGTLKDSNLSNNTSSICITPITPIIATTIATCSAPGTSKINNYNPSNTYVFSPPTIGITIDGAGLISGLVLETAYTVTAVNGNCTSIASISFSNQNQIALPTITGLVSNSPICVGSSAIFTITGTAGNVVTYTGASSGTATIGPLGVVSVTIPNVTNAVTLNLTNITNGICNRALTSTITLAPQAPPNAGTNGTLTVCQGTTPTNAQLFAQLGGTPAAGGTWSNVANVYTYTVTATAPCTTNATATVTVSTQVPPNAGTNGTLTVCQGTTPTNAQLFAQLGGTPATGGTWSNVANVYTYTVLATAPCATNATATITVTTQAPPNAGNNGTLTVCQGTTPTNAQLFAQLGGTPAAGGTWSNVANVYTYTVTATAPCTTNATATVTVITQASPNAGTNGTLTVCQGTTPTNAQLFARLGGTPAAGGTWSNVANVYTYTVLATAPCATNATATVTVNTQAPPNAGTNGTLTVCQGTTPTNAQLFARLGGTPAAGGTWSNVANVYTYTVLATAPCTTNATATVTVTTQALPIVGITGNTSLNVGSTILLSPSTGGTWVSSNSTVATVTNGGLVTGLAIGQVKFTFNSINGCSNTTASIIVSQSLLPIVSISDAVTVEGGNIVFSVDLSKSYEFDIILTFDYQNGTAADPDYTKTITLLIPAGTISTTLTVASLEDSIDELDETFTLSISTSNIVGVGISDTAIGTILNNDIDAVNDIFMPIDGGKGGVTPSLLINDTIGTKPVVISDVILTTLPLPAGLTLQSNGTIIVAPGTLPGTYPITYTICQVSSPNICDIAVSNVIVTETNIEAAIDDYKTPINSAIGGEIKNIISNDLLNGQPVVSTNVIISLVNPSSNLYNFTVDNNGNFRIPEGLPKGSYRVEYQICEKLNPTNCTTSFVLFEVLDPCDFDDSPSSCDLIVHNAISPDDASSNKIFIIEGIEKYPNNTVDIYNRWGVLVYQVEGYDNNQKSFTGFSDGRSTIKKIEKLPEGTYYYTLQYVKKNGLIKKVAGFLLIER